MRVLVCGSRSWRDFEKVNQTLDALDPKPTAIIEGGARGADVMGAQYAVLRNLDHVVFLADWEKYGRAAGPIRNAQMLREGKPDLVVAFWDGKSAGTRDMIQRTKDAGVECRIIHEGSNVHPSH